MIKSFTLTSIVAMFVLSFLPCPGLFGQVEFYQHVLTSSITQGIDTWAEDLNRDGFVDILSASGTSGGEITYWENDGFQHFIPYEVTTGFEWVRSVRAGDIDGDLMPDIVACSWAGNTIKWWKNTGNGFFFGMVVDSTFIGAHTVDIKDVNGDGFMDILCSSFDTSPAFSEIAWWENMQNTGWEKHVISSIFQQSTFIYGEKINDDQDMDVIACCEELGDIYWWENLGNESFTAHLVDDNLPKVHTIIARDLDQDGDMDILAAACMSSLIAWYENTDGQQFLRHDLGSFGGALWLDAADMDLDNDLDLVGAGQGTSKLAWWENNQMQFTKHDVQGSFSGAFCLTLVNIDNDSDIDIVAAAYNSNKISWFENLFDRANLLNGPASVVYDSNQSRYLISNWNTGNILQMNIMGQLSYLNTGLYNTAGLCLSGNLLYAASNHGDTHGLALISLASGNTIQVYDIPGLVHLKDITSDNQDYLYVTDFESNRIFKIATSNYSGWIFSDSPLLHHPAGILYDEVHNRLLVANEAEAGTEILAVDLADSSVTVMTSSNALLPWGLTMDTSGNVYFSSMSTGSIYRYDPDFINPGQVVSTGHEGPADLFFNQHANVLAVPEFEGNSIDFVPVSITSVEPGGNIIDPFFRIRDIFPNPFRDEVIIHYSLLEPGSIHIMILSVDGVPIRSFDTHVPDSGDYNFTWDGKTDSGKDAAPGVYMVLFNTQDQSFAGKLVMY